ncbi:MAG: carboxypeptidase-like regulatory domain-containing protein, partial [Thermoanaerobaculia bacterium]
MARSFIIRSVLLLSLLLATAGSLFAQQTGEVAGRVSAVDGSVLPGVTVEARSKALPQARVTTTDNTGHYRLPVLQPGTYTLTFSLAGMRTTTRTVQVLLNQTATVNVAIGLEGMSESITVTADATLVSTESTEV